MLLKMVTSKFENLKEYLSKMLSITMHTECVNIFQLHRKEKKESEVENEEKKKFKKKIHCVVGLWSTFYSLCVYERFA